MFSIVLLGSCQKEGCTDPLATNYDENATQEDGSCNYINSPYYTIITDTSFENKLIGIGYDDVIDGKVLTSNISSIEFLNIGANNILDFTGIEDFDALTIFSVTGGNVLSNLDLSNNTALERLTCSNNQLTSLDVSQNIALTHLNCIGNQLTSLDVSQNTALTLLQLNLNQLTSLDVSQNTALTFLDVSDNSDLSCLNLKNGNNLNLQQPNGFMLGLDNTPNLNCIEVDDPNWANWSFWTGKNFSNNCNYPAGCF